MFENQSIKSNHRVLIKHQIVTFAAPVFVTEYITNILVTEMCINQDEH
jgi:hypothetical protein